METFADLTKDFEDLERRLASLRENATFRAALSDFLRRTTPVAVEILRPLVHAAAAAAGDRMGPAAPLMTHLLDAAADAGLDEVRHLVGADAGIVAAAAK